MEELETLRDENLILKELIEDLYSEIDELGAELDEAYDIIKDLEEELDRLIQGDL